jgi:type II secretory pathway pseudopilin PulG
MIQILTLSSKRVAARFPVWNCAKAGSFRSFSIGRLSGRIRDEFGFTLMEMLAVVVSMFAVLSAATGFLLLATLRQKAVLEATQLESHHSQLAETISNAIKTADDLQIFENGYWASVSSTQQYYGRGRPSGNYLSCRHDEGANGGLIEQDFEYGENGTITETTKYMANTRPNRTETFPFARIPQSTCFSMRDGIPQAHWQVFTSLDRVDFNVYAMPLNLR